VRFEAELLSATNAERVEAFARAIAGFARRLGTQDRARFLLGLDAPLYQMQGEAAVDAEGGLHPKHRIMRYHDFFVERVKPGERVIDLGCGVGALAASIAQRSEASVTGMDWSEKNLARARETAARSGLSSRLEYVLGDITKDAAKPGGGAAGFDVLVLSNVLEHIADRPERLRTWAKWYQPQRFLIRVPRIDRDWRVPFKKELGLEWRLDDTHETEYTREQLRAELAQAGLKVTEWVEAWEEFWVSAEAA
jgi:2-polyprenyl-3-methyl-5-hydroxy-6-metoxy-1,4-benzoquinol methylase